MDTPEGDTTLGAYYVVKPAENQPPQRGNVGRSDYEQLCLAVGNYLAQHGVSMINYSGQWGVTAHGERKFFYGAGDAFEYATSQIGKDE